MSETHAKFGKDIEIIVTTITISLLIIAVIGFIAQRIGICLIRGVGQALDGDSALLLAILLSGCWLWVYFLATSYLGWENSMPRYAFHPVFLLGGFIFGIGAGINQACSVSTMNRFTKGDLSMMLTMGGWAVGWCLWMSVSLRGGWSFEFYQTTEHFSNQTIFWFFVPAFLITVQRLVFKPDQRRLWLGIIVFGLLASTLFLLQPDWPPSRLIQDTGDVIFNSQNTDWPSAQRYLLLLGLTFGMWYSAIRAQQFRLQKITIKRVFRHFPAGTLMGIGGAVALGGNDSHLLLGLPTLSFASMAAVVGMLSGIVVERWVYRRYFAN
ncbi:YeeE/YedE thiosulfate transporter family protein [Arenicella xantha]|uniref:Uncharacterized protein n=1 Tax=Arenicella xantha TaxID=644221 RepID=A0A395JPV4_9GAMM|nr:YeeE/YedE thiosulfate transporter family protein [Arenicella xantha]RBP53537.1 hypothetical protein DFR28_101924 [Arenicella xantha]